MIDADDANRPVVAAVPGGKAAPDEAAPDEAADGAEPAAGTPAAGTPAAWAAPLARDEDEEAPEVTEPEHPATSAIPPASRAMTAFFVRMEVGRGAAGRRFRSPGHDRAAGLSPDGRKHHSTL